MAERWGINVDVVAIKDHYRPLWVYVELFFSYNLYLRDKSRSFFDHKLTGRYFVKNADISTSFYLKTRNGTLGYKY